MATCASCGSSNRDGARFCDACGAPLSGASPAREVRKRVTVLFCDITGSTSLGEALDPEALRTLLARYFDRMRAIVESHGGTVEKFIGDAVMAVFGVPVLHEDDALRAVRSASEMRDALPELGLQARIGVNTGEVVAGTAERLATGDAVNVAARLEQAAGAGEVLIGAETLRLVRDAVDVEAIEPIQLKGKSDRVAAYRLLGVHEPKPRFGAEMVGRKTELERLRQAYVQAVQDRSCHLFTVLGTAGVGKSRLAAELLHTLEDARVVVGRCLSYGRGITYWPVVEVLKQLDSLPSDEAAADAIRSLLGESEVAASAEEIAWAFRKLLEEQAQDSPFVCVLDDLHWGEETLLDLVEHVADLARDAPIVLLCMARPELLERRPGWGGGKWNATTVLLESLDAAETDELLGSLGGVPERLRARIGAVAEGNPLFLEELVALVREAGHGEVEVPPTVQALLAARLDQLDPGERSVLERGAVEGRTFHRGSVEALGDGGPPISSHLIALVRKELVRPDKAQLPGDEGYRFRHLLIRDAAYDAMPKGLRAELHERFARWLEQRGADLVELDEILGHHLEQAARYRDELGTPDPDLAERAGERLAAAGRRALWRRDLRAAAPLLERALGLLRPLRFDVHLEVDLASAQLLPTTAAEIADEAAVRAAAAADATAEALARVVAAHSRSLSSEGGVDELEELALAACPLLERAGDHAGLVHVWSALGEVANSRGRFEDYASAAEKWLTHSRLAGHQTTYRFGLSVALTSGPRPAGEALRTLDAALPARPDPGDLVFRAVLLAMLGRFDQAWPIALQASQHCRELRGSGLEGIMSEIPILAGDHEHAAECLRIACDFFEEHDQRAYLSTYAPMLARELCALGRHDEAEPLARLGRELGDEQDAMTQMFWRLAEALTRSSRGDHAVAERLAREALSIAERTDALSWQGTALSDLAEVLHAAGRTEEAATMLEQALERHERKKNVAMAAQVRDRLAALREEPQPA